MAQSRHWCFTENVLDSPALSLTLSESLKSGLIDYAVFQMEIAPRTLHRHAQGYVIFPRKIKLGGVQKIVSRTAHWEKTKGTPVQARDYCMKTESRMPGLLPFEFGVFPSDVGQGRRNDVVACMAAVKSGVCELKIAEDFPSQWLKYHKSLSLYRCMVQPARDWVMDVSVLVGPSGSGKSRGARDRARLSGHDVFVVSRGDSNQSVWFDGYVGQGALILDDFYGWLPWNTLLNLLDRYAFNLQIKGGTVPFTSKQIYITSNSMPCSWYKNIPNSDLSPLARRVTRLLDCQFDVFSVVPFVGGVVERDDGHRYVGLV